MNGIVSRYFDLYIYDIKLVIILFFNIVNYFKMCYVYYYNVIW